MKKITKKSSFNGTKKISSLLNKIVVLIAFCLITASSFSQTWSYTGSMISNRGNHNATIVLSNSKVLVTGGYDGANTIKTCELYDPGTGVWSSAVPMSVVREYHTATLLIGGKVLVTGGADNGPTQLNSCEIYDPLNNTWTSANPMICRRGGHTATIMSNGNVLVAGGYGSSGYLDSCEIYNPTNNTWTYAGRMSVPHFGHTATPIANGTAVLITGGFNNNGFINTCDLYNSGWGTTGSMHDKRENHTATLLQNGDVLVAGGTGDLGYLTSCEIYHAGTWSYTGSMSIPHSWHTATMLGNNKVLVTGGIGSNNGYYYWCELFNGSTWTITGSMINGREFHTATYLPNTDKVLVTGGASTTLYTNTCEIYTVCTIPAQPGVISGNLNPCWGSSQTYTIAPVTGATSYTWITSAGWTGTSTTTSITATVGNGTTLSVKAVNACGTSIARTLAVTIAHVPATPGAITGLTTVCAGSTNTYTIAAVGGATSYTWTLPSGWTGTSTSTSIAAIAGTGGGNIIVKANNNCGSSPTISLGVTVVNIPNTPGTISGSITVCQGTSQTYTIAAVNGATSYLWTLPSGWTGTSSTTSITAIIGTGSGTITVKAVNSCFTSAPKTLAVTVIPLPVISGIISGNNSVCQGTTQTYSISGVTGASSYSWTLPLGWTGTSNTTSINAIAGANGGNITVTAYNSCGSAVTSSPLVVTVIQLPVISGTISGNNSVCGGTTQTYSISGVTGANSYSWTLPLGWTGTSNTTIINAIAGANGGNITITAYNSCGSVTSSPLAVTVSTSIPATPGTLTGSLNPCWNSSQSYSIAPVTGATSYNWTLPSGWTGSSTSPSINATVGANSGTISVTASNACGTSAASTLAVTVSTSIPATPGAITGNMNPCWNSSQTYSFIPVAGATSYLWSTPTGWTGTSTTNSITVTPNNQTNNFNVRAVNACGSSPAEIITVTIAHTLPQPGLISGPILICKGSTQTYSVLNDPNASSYTWTFPSGIGWTGTSTTSSITVTAGTLSGVNVSVTANNACGSSPIRALWVSLISVTPVTISGVPGNYNFCAQIAPLSVTLTASSGYSTYLWSTTETTPAINVTSANTYIVTATDPSTGCTTTASKIVTNNCALPTSLNSTYITGGHEKFTWIQSQCAVSYTIQICTNTSFSGPDFQTHTLSPSNNYTFNNLLLSTSYFWRIQTNCNTSGTVNSGYSTPQTFTTGNPRMAEEGNAVLAFNIYPNPADKVVTISFSNTTEGDYTIKLIDVMGRVIKSETGNATTGDNAHIMNLDGIAKGIYMVILQKGDSISKAKLVVE